MTNNNSFILFYSNYCDHSKDFLLKLKKLNISLFNKFTKISVDNNSKIPKGIESVPTIIVPSHNYPLTDNSVFIWLDTMANEYCEEDKPEDIQDNEILPFVKNEMGHSFSDNFSFLESDGPLSHSFSFIDNQPEPIKENINAPIPTMERPDSSKNSDNKFNINIEEFKNSRECDPYIMQAPQRK